MRRTRKLTLRARMLAMLVGVTTILLLIMGVVSTYVLSRRADTQAAAAGRRLHAAATLLAIDPALAARQTSYSVVEVPLRSQLAVVPLTRGAQTGELSAAVSQWLRSPGAAQAVALAQQGRPAAAYALLVTDGCRVLPAAGCRPLQMAPQLEVAARRTPVGTAILFVGEGVTSSGSQVRGFIIAELITGIALIALVALGGEWLIGRGLEPLDEMTRTANDITSRGDLTARMPDADDQTEVGRLGSSINTMLDRIQHAFSSRLRSEQKVREFAADASHELRTPLTTIRGYAELYRQGALGPDQLPNAMRRIEQEAERMSTLVAELLELARLDRTSSLDMAETDLAGVVRDAVADAIAVEPGRPARAEAPPRLVAVVDEARIRQVLANLLGNVRAHTPPSTTVVVRLGEISDGVLIEVADAGPGMSREEAIRAFDRFHRAVPAAAHDHQIRDRNGADLPGAHVAAPDRQGPLDAVSGEGAQPGAATVLSATRLERHSGGHARAERSSGSGLGLSIVQAIATAHGGHATLESWPGRGTRVRVWLPVKVVP
ncbi:MAG TPA: HAMP domain-containing sensor histidine kinase [Streptosporangiaceae bacterium]|nr:HAMP domain-containing sensor histidine kinase [Streptosporangiaceae bacterium]